MTILMSKTVLPDLTVQDKEWFKSVFWWFYTKMNLSQGDRHSDSNINSPYWVWHAKIRTNANKTKQKSVSTKQNPKIAILYGRLEKNRKFIQNTWMCSDYLYSEVPRTIIFSSHMFKQIFF
jgi:hypothetical protein